jgi:hypothetical protein
VGILTCLFKGFQVYERDAEAAITGEGNIGHRGYYP